MTRDEKINTLAKVLSASKQFTPQDMKRIEEKTNEQLDYIFSPLDQCIYLEACAGSGKTEVLGLKAAYEICKWGSDKSGIAASFQSFYRYIFEFCPRTYCAAFRI